MYLVRKGTIAQDDIVSPSVYHESSTHKQPCGSNLTCDSLSNILEIKGWCSIPAQTNPQSVINCCPSSLHSSKQTVDNSSAESDQLRAEVLS